ncbi:MAG TPA: cation diffusion facilitator family transporter [Longimicrobiales bacterium]|nr:cation diffusion facilitator family transporter [Longimicrobiales bacterium]
MNGNPSTRALEVRRVLRMVLWMNLAVVGVKLGVWTLSHALSVVAETFHSSLDATNNIFALALARVAAQEPDDDHPYGHTKFETLGALALVGILSITVFELVQHAILRVMAGQYPSADISPWAVALMGFSVVAGVLITRYESRVGRRLGSDLLLADAAHTRADVFTTLAVLVGLVAIRLGYPVADPVATILVAILIAFTGWDIVKESVPVLVDSRAVEPARIESLALEVRGVRSAYQIRSRGRRGERFAELTISVSPDLDVATSHAMADEVEHRVATALGAREVVVHVEPSQ